MLAIDWHGNPAGVVTLPPYIVGPEDPSPDGSLVLAWPDVIDARGDLLGKVDIGQDVLRNFAWARTGDQLCMITSAPTQAPDQGGLRLLLWSPGSMPRLVATVGAPGTDLGIAACDPASGRIVVLGAARGHEGGGGVAFYMVLDTWVINASSGSVMYHASYPATTTGLSATWVVASANANYLAVGSGGSVRVLDASDGHLLASISGVSALGFSGDSEAALLAGTGSHGTGVVLNWRENHVLWTSTAVAQWSVPYPGAAELLVGAVDSAGGFDDLVTVDEHGVATVIARNVNLTAPCPCPSAGFA